jgi:hypothetical protein
MQLQEHQGILLFEEVPRKGWLLIVATDARRWAFKPTSIVDSGVFKGHRLVKITEPLSSGDSKDSTKIAPLVLISWLD